MKCFSKIKHFFKHTIKSHSCSWNCCGFLLINISRYINARGYSPHSILDKAIFKAEISLTNAANDTNTVKCHKSKDTQTWYCNNTCVHKTAITQVNPSGKRTYTGFYKKRFYHGTAWLLDALKHMPRNNGIQDSTVRLSAHKPILRFEHNLSIKIPINKKS